MVDRNKALVEQNSHSYHGEYKLNMLQMVKRKWCGVTDQVFPNCVSNSQHTINL